jgi:hypothetical protein
MLEEIVYQYSFDETIVGDWRLSRSKYEQLQECLKLLMGRIEEWNRTAQAHGASEGPYLKEIADLKQMIDWGEEQLGVQDRTEIVVYRISVASLRYAKAALLYGAKLREAKAPAASQATWPSALREAVKDIAKPLKDIAAKINYPPSDILLEVNSDDIASSGTPSTEWDCFISHASEDKTEFVEHLARELGSRGLKIWYDNFTLKVGDSLRRSIDRGLARSHYGVVVLSPNFFAKEWPQKELDGLVAREVEGRKVILPVWHRIDAASIRTYSPLLADRVAISSSLGVKKVADALIDGMNLNVKFARKSI